MVVFASFTADTTPLATMQRLAAFTAAVAFELICCDMMDDVMSTSLVISATTKENAFLHPMQLLHFMQFIMFFSKQVRLVYHLA